ncbi:MAG TPA: pyridoxal phosphate-dependent aminotransferase [Candidatus Omnitrophota bacterium]|nr:pyridoxal phosphate-dependent aminotransferase [Candidatus Omnitrophota bacterium]HRZ15102.1 pyridoxal phosphate-dependent aminotransferase [Candidatus Omnitrophota bacterium]
MRIDTRLSERIKKINPSATLAITSKANKLKAEGKDVVSFAAGEPDVDTPDVVKEAAIAAIHSGFTKYTPTTGIPDLKKAIAEKFKRDNGLAYETSQIVVSCGAKHSIFNTLFVLLNRSEEAIIPAPFWVSYPEMAHLCEAGVKFIKTTPENNFKITPAELERHIHAKTKLLILNSPSNPTGCVYSKEELQAIAAICVSQKIFVVSDEIYEKIIFDGQKHVSIGSLGKEIYDLTITVNGLSKSHSMTGWRIGYLGGPADIVEAIGKLQDHSTSNPTSIAQKAALAALQMPDAFSQTMCAEFEKRRNYIASRLDKMKKISYVKPQGAFYIFCSIAKTKLDSFTFAQRLLDEMLVAVIPGQSFGADTCIRISFATGMQQIEKGMNRLDEFLKKL